MDIIRSVIGHGCLRIQIDSFLTFSHVLLPLNSIYCAYSMECLKFYNNRSLQHDNQNTLLGVN